MLDFSDYYWNIETARALAQRVEEIAPNFGCHVALTGGCLYKEGLRKDCDLIFYRIRQVSEIDLDGLVTALDAIGVRLYHPLTQERLWCYKAYYHVPDDRLSYSLDLLFPEFGNGCYGQPQSAVLVAANQPQELNYAS